MPEALTYLNTMTRNFTKHTPRYTIVARDIDLTPLRSIDQRLRR